MSLFDEQFEIFHGVSVLYRENPVISHITVQFVTFCGTIL